MEPLPNGKMNDSSARLLRFAGVAMAVILLWVAFYPGTLASPYVTSSDSPRYAHTIIPESSSLYDDYTEESDLPVYQYAELSPVAQELFDRTRAAEPRPQYGDQRRFVPHVCPEFMLVCDTYAAEELPEEFTYGEELSRSEALQFVVADGERYLLRTGTTSHGAFFPYPDRLVVAWLTMLPLSVLIGYLAVTGGNRRVLGASLAIGGGVASLGVLAPYLELYGLLAVRPVSFLLVGTVGLTLLAIGGRGVLSRKDAV